MTTWLGDIRNWWDGPADWAFGFLLTGIIAVGLTSWRVLAYARIPKVLRGSSGEAEMISGFIFLVFGLVAGIPAVSGTNGAMIFNVLSFLGGLLLVTGGIVWLLVRTTGREAIKQ